MISSSVISLNDISFQVRYQGRISIAERSKSGDFIDSWLLNRQSRLLQSEVSKCSGCGFQTLSKSALADVKNVFPLLPSVMF